MKKSQKFLSMVLVIAMCLTILAGCSLFPPKNATELLKRVNEAMDGYDNYNVVVDMSIDAHVEGNIQGANMTMDMPIEMSMSYDVAGEYAHGDMDMSASIDVVVSYMGESQSMDEDISQKIEMYTVTDKKGEVVTTYSRKDDEENWVVSEEELEGALLDFNSVVEDDEGVFEDAEMEKDGDEYIVTLELADAFENESFRNFLADNVSFNAAGKNVDIDWDEFANSIEDAEVVYVFDVKTYLLKSFTIDKFTISDVSVLSNMSSMDLGEMDLEEFSMTIGISMDFDNYGEIDVSDVKVPKKISKNATEEVSGDKETPPETRPEVVGPETNPVVEPEEVEIPGDYVFYYEGAPVEVPTDYTVFLNDGWYPREDGVYSSFLCLGHDKYDGMSLYLFTNDGSGSEEYVKTHGSDGFSIDRSYCKEYPNVSFAGLTFGDSWNDVISVLGEPDSEYRDDTYRDAEWEITYCGKECSLSIVLLNDEVVNFSISHWG